MSLITIVSMIILSFAIATKSNNIRTELDKQPLNEGSLKSLYAERNTLLSFMIITVVPWFTCCILSIILCILYAKNYRPVALASGALGFSMWPLLTMIVMYMVFTAHTGSIAFSIGQMFYMFFMGVGGVFLLTIIVSSLVLAKVS